MKYCDDYAALLDLYVDGELPPCELADVQAHLDACPGCRAYVDDALAIRTAFPGLDDTDVPAGFAEGVMASIRTASQPEPAASQKAKRPWARVLVPLAACLAVVILLQSGPLSPRLENEAAMDTAAVTAAEAAEESISLTQEDTASDSGAPLSGGPAALSDFSAAPEMASEKNESRAVPSDTPAATCFDSDAVLALPAQAGETALLSALTPVQTEDGALQYLLSAEEYAVLLDQLAEAGVSLAALPAADGFSDTVLVSVPQD